MLNGLETMRYDANRIVAYRGSAADNTGKYLITAERSIFADVTKTGAGGRDDSPSADDLAGLKGDMQPDPAAPSGYRAAYRQGAPHEGLPLEGWYMPVYVGCPGPDGLAEAELILTRHQSSMRANELDSLALDPSYLRRNAPVAWYYDPATGFRPMVCAGWPQPYCVWTLTDQGPLRIAAGLRGSGDAPVEIDARRFVPPAGRLLRLQVEARSDGGTGDVRLMTLPRPSSALSVATLDRPGETVRATAELAVTSQRRFHVVIPSGVSVDLVALGFSMLQPN